MCSVAGDAEATVGCGLIGDWVDDLGAAGR